MLASISIVGISFGLMNCFSLLLCFYLHVQCFSCLHEGSGLTKERDEQCSNNVARRFSLRTWRGRQSDSMRLSDPGGEKLLLSSPWVSSRRLLPTGEGVACFNLATPLP